jgi:hypothetical protein|tara:strand:+ start:1567 stop:1716 length:150 start_codon:yes stop_codon:yes gene_type:complete
LIYIDYTPNWQLASVSDLYDFVFKIGVDLQLCFGAAFRGDINWFFTAED